MDERFVFKKIQYMWTDRDQVCAIEIRRAYEVEKNAGKSHNAALEALRGKIASHKFYASPYKMLITLFTQADPVKLWDKLIIAGQMVELSQKEFLSKCAPPKHGARQIQRFKKWKDFGNVAWRKVKGAERDAVRGASSLGDALNALHDFDSKRFPAALYAKRSTGFKDFAAFVFDFWGNTEYRRHATKPRNGFDYANPRATIHMLKPVIAGHSLEYVPVFMPPKVTRPVTPGKNKIAATKPVDFAVHLSKLKRYAETNRQSDRQMAVLRSHQARAEALAKRFEAFHEIYPQLARAALPAAAAAMRRLGALSDEEVFNKNISLFSGPPAVSLGAFGRAARPSKPPFEAGLQATRNLMRLLTRDPEAAKSARAYAAACLNANRGLGHTYSDLKEIQLAVCGVTMADNELATAFGGMVDQLLMAAPDEGVKAARQLSSLALASPGASEEVGFIKFLLELNGARMAPWAKFVPQVVGNFQGPPSLSVALASSAGYLSLSRLQQQGHHGALANRHWKWVQKLFNADVRKKMEAAVHSSEKGALAKFLENEFTTARGVRVFRGRQIGTPHPAGDVQTIDRSALWGGKVGFGIFGIVAICQVSAQIEAARKFYEGGSRFDPDAILELTSISIGTVQTVAVAYEAAAQMNAWFKKVAIAARTAKTLQQMNIALGVASSGVGLAQNFYEADKLYRKGEHGLMWVKIGKGTAHGVLLLMVVAPYPPLQAAAIGALLGLELVEMFVFGEDQSPVNEHLRNLAQLAQSTKHNPLAPFLSDAERATLKKIEAMCNNGPILHPQAGMAPDFLGLVKVDAKKLRHVGFTLGQISNLLGRTLSVDVLE